MSRFAIDSLAVLSLFLTLVKCVNVINCESAIIWHNIQVAGRSMDHHVWYYRINLPVVIMWWRSEGWMVTLLATWRESERSFRKFVGHHILLAVPSKTLLQCIIVITYISAHPESV